MKMFKKRRLWIPAIVVLGFIFIRTPVVSQTDPDYSSLFAGQNLLLNPDFENGASGWTLVQDNPGTLGAIDNDIFFNGNSSARLQINDDTTDIVAAWVQSVNVRVGHRYLFEYAVRTEAVNLMAFPFFNYQTGESVRYVQSLFPSAGTANWQVYRSRFIVPPQVDKMTVFLFLFGRKGTAWFDALSLHELGDSSMTVFSVDLSRSVGVIHSHLSTNVGPRSPENPNDLTAQFQEIGIEMVRTHDYAGPTDMHVIFPDTSADPLAPNAYDFASTDAVIRAIIDAGSKVFFRLGESFEEPPVHNFPPADYDKWAQVCVQIIKHYNEGWNNGFFYNIRIWEIWNEPDITRFWTGTATDYARLYRITATKIKQHDPNLQVGGPALANLASLDFLTTFLDSVSTGNVPLDFFSYHFYDYSNPYFYLRVDSLVQNLLSGYGLANVPRYLTEWNNYVYDAQSVLDWGRDDALNAAQEASTITYLQDSDLAEALRYRTDQHLFGLFRENGDYSYSGLVFKALAQFTDTLQQLQVSGGDRLGTTALAGKSGDGNRANLLIADNSSSANGYVLHFDGLAQSDTYTYEIRRIDALRQYVTLSTGEVSGSTPELVVAARSPFADHVILQKKNVSGISEGEVPGKFELQKNYPNPFNPETTIRYQLPKAGQVTLTIYNTLGQEVRTLVNQNQAAGNYAVAWNGKNAAGELASGGMYFYKLKFGESLIATRKMLYLK